MGVSVFWGRNRAEHDQVLNEVLTKLQNAGIALNRDKYLFSIKSVTFFWNVLSINGISIEPEKVIAITNMKPPTDVKGLQCFWE